MEVPKTLRCETFVMNPEMLPSVSDLIRESDPEQVASLYLEAGLVALADNAEPLKRATGAAQSYQGITPHDYGLYAGYLSDVAVLAACAAPPPQEALSVLAAAQKARLFDDIMVLSHPDSGESLVVGCVAIGHATRYFKIAHWGYDLVKLEDLHMRRSQQILETLKRRFRARRPRSPRWGRRGPVYFGIVTLLAALPCWLSLIWVSWWVFMPVLAVAMILGGVHVKRNSRYDSAERLTVGWLIFANAVAAIATGGVILNHAATANRTEEVLVCSIRENTLSENWLIDTSAGPRELEAGFYNGTYYSSGAEAVAKQFKGSWVKLTVHGIGNGGSGFGGPYVTGGRTLRPGACG